MISHMREITVIRSPFKFIFVRLEILAVMRGLFTSNIKQLKDLLNMNFRKSIMT